MRLLFGVILTLLAPTFIQGIGLFVSVVLLVKSVTMVIVTVRRVAHFIYPESVRCCLGSNPFKYKTFFFIFCTLDNALYFSSVTVREKMTGAVYFIYHSI